MNYSNAKYEINFCDSFGNSITLISTADTNQFQRLAAVRGVGQVGALTIEFSGGAEQSAFFPLLERYGALRKDAIIEVWRITNGFKSLWGDTVWFVRQVTRSMSEQGVQSISIVAYDGLYLLTSRIVVNPFVVIQEPKITLTGSPSDNMTRLVRDAFLRSPIFGDRSIPNFSAPRYQFFEDVTVQIDVARTPLLEALQMLSEVSIQQSSPVYFDVVATSASSLMFQVFPGQRGLDRRLGQGGGAGVILGSNTGIIREITTITDWTDEITAVFPWGANGSTVNKFVTNPFLPVPPISSPFARREAISDAGNGDNDETLSIAFADLQAKRGTWNVSCTLQDTNDFVYGVDWGYGDRLFLNAFGTNVDCRIMGIEVEVANKQEFIRLSLNVTEEII